MDLKDIARAQTIGENKKLAEQTLNVLADIAGIEMRVRWPSTPPDSAGPLWPPATCAVLVERDSPFFAVAVKAFEDESRREIEAAAAELAALGITG